MSHLKSKNTSTTHYSLPTTHYRRGFTLIEILLVVAAIAILAGIVILAINPTKQLGDTRNAQRRSDVTTILNAAYQYAVDHDGTVPTSILTLGSCDSSSAAEICRSGGSCTGFTDLATYLVAASSTYLVSIPFDPTGASTNGAGYKIFKDSASNRLTVCAPDAEQGETISVTR